MTMLQQPSDPLGGMTKYSLTKDINYNSLFKSNMKNQLMLHLTDSQNTSPSQGVDKSDEMIVHSPRRLNRNDQASTKSNMDFSKYSETSSSILRSISKSMFSSSSSLNRNSDLSLSPFRDLNKTDHKKFSSATDLRSKSFTLFPVSIDSASSDLPSTSTHLKSQSQASFSSSGMLSSDTANLTCAQDLNRSPAKFQSSSDLFNIATVDDKTANANINSKKIFSSAVDLSAENGDVNSEPIYANSAAVKYLSSSSNDRRDPLTEASPVLSQWHANNGVPDISLSRHSLRNSVFSGDDHTSTDDLALINTNNNSYHDNDQFTENSPDFVRKSPSIPILELHEPTCSLYSSFQQEEFVRNSRMYQPYKGQLLLSVYVNSGLLTCHVMKARQLSNTFGSDCNSYIKLSLTPDENKRSKCKTGVRKNSNSPNFDEKFSFELLDGDMKKRLQISMWHKENNHTPSELLGCMSFGVKHILQQKNIVDGWYYLLSDAIGRRKHLQVSPQSLSLSQSLSSHYHQLPPPKSPYLASQKQQQLSKLQPHLNQLDDETQLRKLHQQKLNSSLTTTQTSTTEEDSGERVLLAGTTTASESPLVSAEEEGSASNTVTVVRSEAGGFGFQVSGERPARILKLQPGSPSARAGLLQGDCLLRVNDSDVSDLSSDTVARILRQCPNEVKITYERHRKKPPDLLQGTSQDITTNATTTDNTTFIPLKTMPPNEYINMAQVKPPGSPAKDNKSVVSAVRDRHLPKTDSPNNLSSNHVNRSFSPENFLEDNSELNDSKTYVNMGGSPLPEKGILKPPSDFLNKTPRCGFTPQVISADTAGLNNVNQAVLDSTNTTQPVIGRRQQVKPPTGCVMNNAPMRPINVNNTTTSSALATANGNHYAIPQTSYKHNVTFSTETSNHNRSAGSTDSADQDYVNVKQVTFANAEKEPHVHSSINQQGQQTSASSSVIYGSNLSNVNRNHNSIYSSNSSHVYSHPTNNFGNVQIDASNNYQNTTTQGLYNFTYGKSGHQQYTNGRNNSSYNIYSHPNQVPISSNNDRVIYGSNMSSFHTNRPHSSQFQSNNEMHSPGAHNMPSSNAPNNRSTLHQYNISTQGNASIAHTSRPSQPPSYEQHSQNYSQQIPPQTKVVNNGPLHSKAFSGLAQQHMILPNKHNVQQYTTSSSAGASVNQYASVGSNGHNHHQGSNANNISNSNTLTHSNGPNYYSKPNSGDNTISNQYTSTTIQSNMNRYNDHKHFNNTVHAANVVKDIQSKNDYGNTFTQNTNNVFGNTFIQNNGGNNPIENGFNRNSNLGQPLANHFNQKETFKQPTVNSINYNSFVNQKGNIIMQNGATHKPMPNVITTNAISNHQTGNYYTQPPDKNQPFENNIANHCHKYKNSTCESEETSSDGGGGTGENEHVTNQFYISSLVAREEHLKNPLIRAGHMTDF